MALYQPDPKGPDASLGDLGAYMVREFERIAQALVTLEGKGGSASSVQELHKPPSKPQDFMLVAADGKDWNPGNGRGLYVFLNGIWNPIDITPQVPDVPTPPPDVDPGADPAVEFADFVSSFESDVTDGENWAIQARDPSRVALTTVSRLGTRGVKLTTLPGDTGISGSGSFERCDLRANDVVVSGNIAEGLEQWWAHSIYLPDDWKDPPDGAWHTNVLFDFHHTGGTGPAPMTMTVTRLGAGQPPRWVSNIYGGQPGANRTNVLPFGDEPPARNTWYDFVYNIIWASDNTGLFKIWARKQGDANYTLRYTRSGLPTLYSGQGAYVKLANYHDYTGPCSVIHDRIVRGRSAQAVAMAPLV